MPNWVTVRGSSRITAVDFDGEEPRIYVRLKADKRTKVRRLSAKYACLPNPGELEVERVLQQVKLLADNEVTG